jgi:hypothetical protein
VGRDILQVQAWSHKKEGIGGDLAVRGSVLRWLGPRSIRVGEILRSAQNDDENQRNGCVAV